MVSLLIIPFFIAGLILVNVFTLYSNEIGKYYFIDLIGASFGSILIIPLITVLGPTKLILSISFIIFLNYILIKKKRKNVFIIGILIFFAFALFIRFEKDIFPLIPKMKKRAYLLDYRKDLIEYSKWSPINKIDVAPFLKQRKKVIWIDAGTMQSWLVKFNGNIKKLKQIQYGHEAIPYLLSSKKRSALIIGAAGGYEALCALSNRFKYIIGVELDPVIVDLVNNKYSNYLGNIFKLKNVKMINDEGRSFLRRTKRKFDVIQMVNSHNTNALLSGGVSIAETYIYTVESFKDYWNHLNENGILSIVHWFGERMFSTAVQALRELNIKDIDKKFVIVQAKKGFNFFFLKKGNFTDKEMSIIKNFLGKNKKIVYSPYKKMENIYYNLMSNKFNDVISKSSVNINPVRDNSPYFNQPNKVGQFSFDNIYVEGMAKVVIKWASKYSNGVYLTILIVSILFPLFLIYLPLRFFNKKDNTKYKRMIGYFFIIGMAFIMVEIILIKIFQLFLGNPAYSISAILASLLISSGIGSYFSKRFNFSVNKKTFLTIGLILSLILIFYSVFLFKLISLMIHFKLVLRFLVTFILLFLPGFFMGLFFPTGINYLGEKDKNSISWAWGANSFATVLGSILTVIISINWNFNIVLFIAALLYLSSALLFVYEGKGLE